MEAADGEGKRRKESKGKQKVDREVKRQHRQLLSAAETVWELRQKVCQSEEPQLTQLHTVHYCFRNRSIMCPCGYVGKRPKLGVLLQARYHVTGQFSRHTHGHFSTTGGPLARSRVGQSFRHLSRPQSIASRSGQLKAIRLLFHSPSSLVSWMLFVTRSSATYLSFTAVFFCCRCFLHFVLKVCLNK